MSMIELGVGEGRAGDRQALIVILVEYRKQHRGRAIAQETIPVVAIETIEQREQALARAIAAAVMVIEAQRAG